MIIQWFVKPLRTFIAKLRYVRYSKLRRRELDKFFKRHIPEGDEGWELESGDAPIFIADNVSLKPLFSDPHEKTEPIQLRTTKTLFDLIGGGYVPRRLRTILKKADAFRAVNSFLKYLNLEFQLLLSSREHRAAFNRYLEILMEVDEICGKIGLSDLPVYQALAAGNIDKAEALIDLLHTARRIYQGINDTRIIFPDYQRSFVSPAVAKISMWEKLDESTLNELHEILNEWQYAQDLYNETTDGISVLIKHINSFVIDDKRIKYAFYRIVEQVDAIRQAIEHGSEGAGEGIEKLQQCYDELNAIYESIKDVSASAYEEETYERETSYRTSVDKQIEDYLAVLNLNGMGQVSMDQLKRAYRKLMSRYHPDRNPSPDAHAKTQAINKAYKHLNDCLGRGVDLYA